MPIHDFACTACGARFEELVKLGERPPCPDCGGQVERLLSQFAPPHKFGLRGGDARRSEAQRRAKREQAKDERWSRRSE